MWLSLHVASIKSLGDCDVCNKLHAWCMTHPIITFRGSHNKVLPVPSSSSWYLCYGTEIGDDLQNDRILSFLPLILCEKQLDPAACRYYTVIKCSAILLVSPIYWRHPRKPWKIAIHEAIVSTIVTYSWRVGMPTNHRQQKGWEFGETTHKTVATSVYKFWHWHCIVNDWELRGLNLPVI